MNFVDAELSSVIDSQHVIDSVSNLKGKVFRDVASRKTFRFEHGGRGYFAKVHLGVGWSEIFKNLLSIRLPILSASNELLAIKKLTGAGVPTMTPVAFASEGRNPAHIRSCIVTRELENTISLEDLAASGPPPLKLKRYLLEEVARMARNLHAAGVNHRDLYICHFLMSKDEPPRPTLYLIDLHRAQIRDKTPVRWLVKDVGGLLFSVMDLEMTYRDLLRFVRIYSGKSLRETLETDSGFWRAVLHRARKLYLQDQREVPARFINWENR